MSRIIKAGGVSGAVLDPQPIAFCLGDVRDRADQVLDQVRLEAARIVEQARREAEAIRARAAEEGKQAAIAAAERVLSVRLDEQLRTLLPAMEQAVEGVHQARHAWLRRWEDNAVHLACAVAEKIVRGQLARRPELALATIRAALELASDAGQIRLLLHPDDVAALGARVNQVADAIARLGPTTIVPDAGVARGGCRVQTDMGEIDATLATQLARIEQELCGD